MNQLIIDTSAYSAFRRGDIVVEPYFTSTHEILVPTIVLGELRAGFCSSRYQVENERLLQKFLDLSNVSTINMQDSTTKEFGKLYKELRGLGKPIGQNDLWIVSLVREHRVPLLTLDQDFQNIRNIEIMSVSR